METFVYFGGISNLMNQTHKASARRCRRIWKQILQEEALAFYASLEYKYNWLRQQEIM